MTFKTLKEANELLQTLEGKTKEIARMFKGCDFTMSERKFTLTGDVCLHGNAIGTDNLKAGWNFRHIIWYKITALPKSTHHTREQIQARINEINASKKERIEKGRSESNEKKRLQRQLDALPRFEVGAVYRPQQDYRTIKTHCCYMYAGLCDDRFFTFLFSVERDGIFLPEMRQINGSEVDRIEFTKIAAQDDRNLQWLLDGKWDEMETTT